MNKFILTATMMALPASSIWAQELQQASEHAAKASEENAIEEVVVTGTLSRYGATKSSLPILETARSVSIETEEWFRNKGALTLDDTLSYTAGVVGDTFGYSTRGDFPKVRGFDAAEYRDGQQVLFGHYNNTRSDVYTLEQVEILKGPASVLYGKGTPGGIVNAISKLAGPNKDSEVVVEGGSYDRMQAAADWNHEISDEWFVRVVGVYRDSDTQVDFVSDDAQILMPSITYDNGQTSVTAMVEWVDRESDTSHQFLPLEATGCASGEVSITPEILCITSNGQSVPASRYVGEPSFNRYDSQSTLFSLLASHEFTDSFSLDAAARYKDAEVDYRQTWLDFGVPRLDPQGNALRTWYYNDNSSRQAAVDVRARWEFDTGVINHEVFAGVGYQDVTTDSNRLYVSGATLRDEYNFISVFNIYNPSYGSEHIPPGFGDGAVLPDGPATTTEDIGFYINDQMSIGNLKVNLGLRRDEVETQVAGGDKQKDDATPWSAGVLYAFESGLSPYFSFAESFEPVIGTDGLTNETLKPREGEQFEAGLKYQPEGTRTYITLAYFDIEESNLPNPQSLPTEANSQQEGIANVDGFELEAETQLGDWYLEATLTLLNTQTVDNVPFDSIPEEQGTLWAQYQPNSGFLEGFRAGFGARYASDSESNAPGLARVVTDGYVLGDAMVGYELGSWDLSLNLRNITDEEYYGTCLARGDCFPGEGRTLVGKVAFQF